MKYHIFPGRKKSIDSGLMDVPPATQTKQVTGDAINRERSLIKNGELRRVWLWGRCGWLFTSFEGR